MYFVLGALFSFSLGVVPMYLSLKIMWPCIIVSGLARYFLSLSPVVIYNLTTRTLRFYSRFTDILYTFLRNVGVIIILM